MHIQPAYSCLLGRPWNHVAGAITSTLHQKPKYELEGQVVTVCVEEDIFVSDLSTFKYVEMDGEMHEMLCQGFEAININEVAPEVVFSPESEKVGTSISSYKQAIEVVKAGNAQGWGKFVEPVIKEDKFGLGYALGSQKNETGTLSSRGLVSPHIVNVADEDKADSDCDLDSWIRPSEEEVEEDCELPEGLARLLKQEDRAITPYQEVIETVNIGTADDKKEIKIGASLQAERKDR
ncbi:hypothetical protein KIW84_031459 [Lathyrus oleraceus]|uniref:Uncharacterized protein n=1 Tax=Pisum sativum TaxID=3888 RepID=A0A9D5AXH0_PEA|nr:hypothetical protein KIW84_031459 [Pisum sativum]